MRETHQNIMLDGKDLGAPARVGSKFTNEGKWNTFISPLLPPGEVFIEYGSNVGMFLKMARKNYETVIGIERERKDHEVALKYRGNKDYRLINANINNYDLYSLPLADVTLLSNFHYHQHIDEFRRLLDKLEARTCYLIIVSVEEPNRHWRAQPHAVDIKHYMRHWKLVKQVPLQPMEGDPHPRPMFSFLYKSPKVERIPLDEIKVEGGFDSDSYKFGVEFVKEALASEDYKKTRYYGIQNVHRHHKWPQERVDSFIEGKYQLVRNISKNGILEPLILDRNGYLVDGLHRYMTLRVLGKDAIVRKM